MKLVYFPFTYISKTTAHLLYACFAKPVVYQPSGLTMPDDMRQLGDQGIIDIRVPVQKDDAAIDAICRQFKEWRNLHQGAEIRSLISRGDSTPFFDDSFTAQIRSDIKKNNAPHNDAEQNDPLFDARVFLQLAQEFDRHSIELNLDLKQFEQKEHKLFAELKGEDEHLFKWDQKNIADGEEPGSYMTKQRIDAWTRLMLKDTDTPDVFITSSKAVLDEMADKLPHADMILETGAIPVSSDIHQRLADHIDLILTETPEAKKEIEIPEAKEGEDIFSLTLYNVPDEQPKDCFRRCLETQRAPDKPEKSRKKGKKTLIGCVEICPAVKE